MLYTSCERNVCDNVTCFNGGSCNSGECRCPTGYEGSQCQTLSVSRFVGTYGGFTSCGYDGGQVGTAVTDTAVITADPNNINFVYITFKNIAPMVLHGYVSNTVSTYAIIVPTDSTYNSTLKFTVTLQSDTKLTIAEYANYYHTTGDTTAVCTFVGTKD
jgi:hypothetical protein